MRLFFATAIIIVLFLLLQSTILADVKPKPDGVLAMTLAAAFLGGPGYGGLTGFFGGLLEDGLSGLSRGSFCLTGLLVGWILGAVFKPLYFSNFLVRFAGAVLGSLIYFLVFRKIALMREILLPGFAPQISVLWLLLQGGLCVLILFVIETWIIPEPLELS